MTDKLRIGLSSWIIQDGNYGDFAVGDRDAFALEFWPLAPLAVHQPKAASIPASMTWKRNSSYEVIGKVSFVAPTWWVLDSGLLMYTDHGVSPGPVGTFVGGEVGVGIDPFFNFERLAMETGGSGTDLRLARRSH